MGPDIWHSNSLWAPPLENLSIMDFDIPEDLQNYLGELDAFWESDEGMEEQLEIKLPLRNIAQRMQWTK